ncbi:uncharacterized protein BDV17DRAFT_258961 [Aspergillus undulatus]|uniref:uncharacterized protein n=1 Tax=Aspergillus undulatus TaxID=1810928 RepID=UPI003CCD0B4A
MYTTDKSFHEDLGSLTAWIQGLMIGVYCTPRVSFSFILYVWQGKERRRSGVFIERVRDVGRWWTEARVGMQWNRLRDLYGRVVQVVLKIASGHELKGTWCGGCLLICARDVLISVESEAKKRRKAFSSVHITYVL